MVAPEILTHSRNLLERERDVAAILETRIAEDQAILLFQGVTMSTVQGESLLLTRVPITETGMLIRKPVADVFEAIVNPEITTQFGLPEAADGSWPGCRFDGIGRCTPSRSRSPPESSTQPSNRHRVAGIQRTHDSRTDVRASGRRHDVRDGYRVRLHGRRRSAREGMWPIRHKDSR